MAEKIGQILIRRGKITAAQLRDALRTQQFFGGYLGSHLINLGFIDEASLGETLSEIYRVPFAPYESIRLAKPETIAKIPADLAQRLRVIPLHIDGNRIHLAMLNPRDAAAVKEVTAVTGLIVAPWVAPEFRIVHALDRHYRVRREKRGAIAVNAASLSKQEDRTAEDARPAVWKDPQAPDIGLDGLPIDATAPPELGGTFVSPRPVGPIPRSLEEWRDAEDEPDPAAAPAAPSRRQRPRSTKTATADPDPDPSEASPGAGSDLDAGAVSRPQDSKARPLEPRESGSPEVRPLPATSIHQGILDIAQLTESLAAVTTRDDLARKVVAFLGGKFKRSASFTVRNNQIVGWVAGEGVLPDRLAHTAVPVAEPSIFSTAAKSLDVHLGSASSDPGVVSFYDALGIAPPPALLLIPVVLRDRVVVFLYADNEADALGPVDLALWRRLAHVMAMSLEILIIKGKMRRT